MVHSREISCKNALHLVSVSKIHCLRLNLAPISIAYLDCIREGTWGYTQRKFWFSMQSNKWRDCLPCRVCGKDLGVLERNVSEFDNSGFIN